jgi:hypothetical protein
MLSTNVEQISEAIVLRAIRFAFVLLFDKGITFKFFSLALVLEISLLAVWAFFRQMLLVNTFCKKYNLCSKAPSILPQFGCNLSSVIGGMIDCMKKDVTNTIVKCLPFGVSITDIVV